MFEILSTILKYVFTFIIYAFIYSIMRLVYLDIRSMSARAEGLSGKLPYLKLLNRREDLLFKVDEFYSLEGSKTLGRSNNNDYIIRDPFLSSEHAEFIVNEGVVYIIDKGSKNGTFVNEQRIDKKEFALSNGDRITVGQLSFVLVIPADGLGKKLPDYASEYSAESSSKDKTASELSISSMPERSDLP